MLKAGMFAIFKLWISCAGSKDSSTSWQQSRIKYGIGISDTDSILLFTFHFPLDQYIQHQKKKNGAVFSNQ